MSTVIWWVAGILAVFGIFFIIEWVCEFWISWPFEQ